MALPAVGTIWVDIASNRRPELSLNPKLIERRNNYGEYEGGAKAGRFVPH
jgi:hypothetical protein